MITAQQFYYLECDEDPCTARYPSLEDDTVAWADPVTLLDLAKDEDWLAWFGQHFCPDHVCFCEACEDVIVPSKVKMCDTCREEAKVAQYENEYIETAQPHKGE